MATNHSVVTGILFFALLSTPAWSATGTAKGKVNCKAGPESLATAKTSWNPQKKELRIQAYKTPQDTRYFVDLSLFLTTDSGKVGKDKIESYYLFLRCPETSYNLNFTVHASWNPEDFYRAFPQFSADLSSGGRMSVAVFGDDKMWEGLSWDFSVDATLP